MFSMKPPAAAEPSLNTTKEYFVPADAYKTSSLALVGSKMSPTLLSPTDRVSPEKNSSVARRVASLVGEAVGRVSPIGVRVGTNVGATVGRYTKIVVLYVGAVKR